MVGSGGRVAPQTPNRGLDEIGYPQWAGLSAGTLQNWPCYGGIYSEKIPYSAVGFSVEIVLLLAK